jgi:hypothetical protein
MNCKTRIPEATTTTRMGRAKREKSGGHSSCKEFCVCRAHQEYAPICGHLPPIFLCQDHSSHVDPQPRNYRRPIQVKKSWARLKKPGETFASLVVARGAYKDACETCNGWDKCCLLQVVCEFGNGFIVRDGQDQVYYVRFGCFIGSHLRHEEKENQK